MSEIEIIVCEMFETTESELVYGMCLFVCKHFVFCLDRSNEVVFGKVLNIFPTRKCDYRSVGVLKSVAGL